MPWYTMMIMVYHHLGIGQVTYDLYWFITFYYHMTGGITIQLNHAILTCTYSSCSAKTQRYRPTIHLLVLFAASNISKAGTPKIPRTIVCPYGDCCNILSKKTTVQFQTLPCLVIHMPIWFQSWWIFPELSQSFGALQLQVPCNALHVCITKLQVLRGIYGISGHQQINGHATGTDWLEVPTIYFWPIC